jgi:hypothetical protein
VSLGGDIVETGDFTPIVETLEASSPVTMHISHTIIIDSVSFMKFISEGKTKKSKASVSDFVHFSEHREIFSERKTLFFS